MTRMPCGHDDRIPTHPHNPIVPRTENLHRVGTTAQSLSTPSTTPQLNVAHMYNDYQFSHSSHLSEFNTPPSGVHHSYLLSSTPSEPIYGTSVASGNLAFSQHSKLYSPPGSFHPSPDLLPNVSSLSVPHHPTLDPTQYSNSSRHQPLWSNNVGDQVPSIPGVPIQDHHVFLLPDSTSPCRPSLDDTLEPYGGTSDASYPCQWTKEGVVCDIMVQPIRSHMSRHLHTYHGFGGSDARQTMCYWAGCGTVMQQGSIARHMVTCHLQAKVSCPMCSKKLSRQDVISKHQRVCPAASTWRQA